MESSSSILGCFFVALMGGLALAVLAGAQNPPGFVSIDCGIPAEETYTDDETGLHYESDAKFVDTGTNRNISSVFRTTRGLARQFSSLRSFPNGTRNCYRLLQEREGTSRYLIRASFMYGNYDAKDQLPQFELHLGVDLWDSIKVDNASIVVTKTIIHLLRSDVMYVCLVNTGLGTPFISALEVRPLNDDIYATSSGGSLVASMQLDLGSTALENIRYRDDVYDRIWSPETHTNAAWVTHNTSHPIDQQGHSKYQLPSKIMQTAITPANNDSLTFYWKPDTPFNNSQVYIYFHVAEIEPRQSREFSIYIDGKLEHPSVRPTYLHTQTMSGSPETGTEFTITLNKTAKSTGPPIINAIECYLVKQLNQTHTDPEEAKALWTIKSVYAVKKNWQGDPCAPKAYSWDGVKCDYIGDYNSSLKIVSLNLSSSGLSGDIAPSIFSLTRIQSLDLSDNCLTGSVPDFLFQLRSLKTLNLTGNFFSGSIPIQLIKQSKSGALVLSIDPIKDFNPFPGLSCKSNSSNKSNKRNKQKFIVPVAASIGTLTIILSAAVTLLCLKRRESVWRVGKVDAISKRRAVPLDSKKRRFTYSEVLAITGNFERVIGKGGFGTVYHGYLNDTEVAVKIISASTIEGYELFRNEAELLLRVHHRNFTPLVGYCDDMANMAVIYEYMANGNLRDHLSDQKGKGFSWEKRLHIAINAAQALEYLHNGCKPPIIHRDVKSTNILLDKDFQARLGDFGLSKMFPSDGAIDVSTRVIGTPGYIDPEYYVSSRLTEKSDVFSFGVVLLEIATGRTAIGRDHEKVHIIQWVSVLLEKGDIRSIADPRLNGEYEVNSMWRAVELGMACVTATSTDRPSMMHVVMELKESLTLERTMFSKGNLSTESSDIDTQYPDYYFESRPLAR